MSVFNLILNDIREGILKNKRFIIIPILCIFECMHAHMNINTYKKYYDIHEQTTFLDFIAEIFHGCDPISKISNPDIKIEIPYFWLAIFIFAVFVGFDYMHNDLTQFGIQVLSRTRNRRSWWISKCVCSLVSSIWFYMIFILTAIVFSLINGYSLDFANVSSIINVLADKSVIYTFVEVSDLNKLQGVCMLLSPLLVICTLNMLQTTLCLLIKPMLGYLTIICILLLGILTDMPLAFSRYGMITFNNWFYEEGYQMIIGLGICLIIIFVSILIGTAYFKKYDILPDKE